jgi:GAF domain-containing protein
MVALRAFDILDSGAEQSYDDLTSLAAHICQTPVALITFIDEHRQWFKSRIGFDLPETSRDEAFCAHTILDTTPLVVNDASVDRRFAANPFVTAPGGVRFYAGAPLVTSDGFGMGSICVIDDRPRDLSAAQISALEALSRQVVRLMDFRKASTQLAEALREVRTLEGLIPMCASCHRVREDNSYWRNVDAWMSAHTDVMVSHAICPDCMHKLYPEFTDADGKVR